MPLTIAAMRASSAGSGAGMGGRLAGGHSLATGVGVAQPANTKTEPNTKPAILVESCFGQKIDGRFNCIYQSIAQLIDHPSSQEPFGLLLSAVV
jgi:hypothetical protein